MNEIDRDFYCSAGLYSEHGYCKENAYFAYPCYHINAGCGHYHRKHPTPEEFKQEYGHDYHDDGAVYYWDQEYDYWEISEYSATKDDSWERYNLQKPEIIVCACTPFGCPPDSWRP